MLLWRFRKLFHLLMSWSKQIEEVRSCLFSRLNCFGSRTTGTGQGLAERHPLPSKEHNCSAMHTRHTRQIGTGVTSAPYLRVTFAPTQTKVTFAPPPMGIIGNYYHLLSNQPAPLQQVHSLVSNQPAPFEQIHSFGINFGIKSTSPFETWTPVLNLRCELHLGTCTRRTMLRCQRLLTTCKTLLMLSC